MTSITNVQLDFDFNEDQFVSLTSMYAKAVEAGRADGKANPQEWSRYAGAVFIKKLGQKLNTGKSRIYKSTRGRNGGTWVHWQIATAYATYLDEEVHMQFNAAVRGLALGDPAIVDVLMRNASEDAQKRIVSKALRHQFTDRLKSAGVVDGLEYGRLTNIITKEVLGGKAEAVKVQRGLKPSDNLRDNLSMTELMRLGLAESMAADAMEAGQSPDAACKSAAAIVARTRA